MEMCTEEKKKKEKRQIGRFSRGRESVRGAVERLPAEVKGGGAEEEVDQHRY